MLVLTIAGSQRALPELSFATSYVQASRDKSTGNTQAFCCESRCTLSLRFFRSAPEEEEEPHLRSTLL